MPETGLRHAVYERLGFIQPNHQGLDIDYILGRKTGDGGGPHMVYPQGVLAQGTGDALSPVQALFGPALLVGGDDDRIFLHGLCLIVLASIRKRAACNADDPFAKAVMEREA
jgi:hypothetical protein